MQASGTFGPTSLDCPPNPGAEVRALQLDVRRATADQTVTVSAANPACRQTGYTGLKCLCDTCNNAAAEVCSSDADCPPSGGNPGVCGGRRCLIGPNAGAPCAASSECPTSSCNRPGEATQPNLCRDDTAIPGNGMLCQDVGGGQGECPEGPYDSHCSIERDRSCGSDADCSPLPFPDGNCPSCLPDQTCQQFPRYCFTDNGIVGNSVVAAGAAEAPCDGAAPITSGALFCLQPPTPGMGTFLDVTFGLPGLGRYRAAETMTLLP